MSTSAKYAARLQYKATQETNAQNLQLAQETNALNYKMFKEQQQYDTDMWNAQNVYNSAEQQRARLESAGLNPYLMMNGGSAGVADSAHSASPIAAQAAHMDTPNIGDLYLQGKQQALNTLNNITGAINQFTSNITNARVADAQIDQIRTLNYGYFIDNLNKQRGYDVDFGYKSSLTKNLNQDTKLKYQNTIFAKNNARLAGLQSDFFEKDMQNKLLNSQLTNDSLKQSITESQARQTLINLDIEAKHILNKYLEPNQIADLALKSAQINLTNADIKTKYAQTRYLVAQAYGVSLNNKIVEKTTDSLIASLNAQNQDNVNYYSQPINNVGLPYQNRRQNDYYNWKNQQKQYRYIPKNDSRKMFQVGPLKFGYDFNYYDIPNYGNQYLPSNSY